jgi:hypothetical protein
MLLEEQDIKRILENPSSFEIASNGGFNLVTGISSYGWVIALNKILVAQGRGPTEAHPDLAESFRSKGYGLASVAAFIMAMVTFLPIQTKKHRWKFYINNKAMIQRMESYKDNQHSKWNLCSDADIMNKAQEYLCHIPGTLIHVKSHQDKGKETRTITFDAQLNIIADALEIRKKISDYLWRDNKNHGNSELNNIIELAMLESIHNKKWKPVMLAISLELLPCIRQQNKIGWYHSYKGRMAQAMTQFMEAHYRTLNVDAKKYTGERWGKMFITNIWNMVLQLWEKQNEIIHGKTTQEEQRTDQQQLQQKVQKFYKMQETLDRTDREKIFYKDMEEIIKEDTRYIKAWLKLAHWTFSAAKKERAKPRNEQKFMEQYFAWGPPISLRQWKQQKQRAQDETHPA